MDARIIDAAGSCGSNPGFMLRPGRHDGLWLSRFSQIVRRAAQSMRLVLAVGMLVDLLQSDILLRSYPLFCAECIASVKLQMG
eukprot:scaffold311473_cov35-Attheya_sp.AAC.1